MLKQPKWTVTPGHKDWHVYVPDALAVKINDIQSRMSPKPTRNALLVHVLEMWANGEMVPRSEDLRDLAEDVIEANDAWLKEQADGVATSRVEAVADVLARELGYHRTQMILKS